MWKKEFKISVIIPVYNRNVSLIRAIDSLYSQTYSVHEIIVIDDNSRFSVDYFLKDYNGVKVIRNSQNLGAAQSRNIGFDQANGNYVAFLDSDDYWHPLKLEKQIEVAIEYPDVGIIYCDQFVVDKHNNIYESEIELIDRDLWIHLINGWTAPNTSTLLFKKNVFKNLEGFDSDLRSCQEHDLWMTIAYKNEQVKFSAEKLSFFCMGEENRISFDYNNRINGATMFLKKWKVDITNTLGSAHYDWFKRDYYFKISLPVFNYCLRNKRIVRAFIIYIKYLSLYPKFYITLKERINGIRNKPIVKTQGLNE